MGVVAKKKSGGSGSKERYKKCFLCNKKGSPKRTFLCMLLTYNYIAGKQAFTAKVMIRIAQAGPSMWESVPELIRFVSMSQISAEIVPKITAITTANHIFPVVL